MSNNPKFVRKDGLFTAYALACGYLNSHAVGDDREAIRMGADGAAYWVKSRVHCDPQPGREGQRLWLSYPRNRDGYRAALSMFRMLRRSVGPAVQAWPTFRTTNQKIDLWALGSDGRTIRYVASTNRWRTARDALAYFNSIGFPGRCFVRATINRRQS